MTETVRNLEGKTRPDRGTVARTKRKPVQSRHRLEQLCSASGIRLAKEPKGDVPVFTSEREAALALLTARTDLAHKEAGLCGHLCVAAAPSPKQVSWLTSLLAKYGLPVLKRQEAC